MKWVWAALPALLVLGGCQDGQAASPETVTVTQAPQTSATAENSMCPEMRVQRDANATLAADGYSQDYSSNYNQMLESLGCAP